LDFFINRVTRGSFLFSKLRYNIDFGEFEKRFVSAKEGKFDLWDDYMAWKFAENGRIGGDKRTGELKNVLQDP